MSEPTRILVVDDDPDIVEVLRIILESADYRVEAVGGSREAHERLVEYAPDLILLDVMMSTDTEGLAFLQALRTEYPEPLARTPVVILSAIYDIPGILRQTSLPERPEQVPATLPAQGFLRKPPEPAVLLSKVAEVLRGEPQPQL